MTEVERQVMKKIVQARSNLIMDEPFFGNLALRLEPIADPTCETFWTDGRHMGFNPAWAIDLTIPETQGVVCHEVLHVSNGHPWRRGGREPKKWNCAADYSINPVIVDAGMVLPGRPLLDSRFRGMAAEVVFSMLPDEPSGGNGQGKGDEKGKGKGRGQGGNEPGCGEVRDAPADDAEALEAEWQVAVFQAVQAAKAQGKLPAGLEKMIEEMRKPKVDWKSATRRFVQQVAKNDYSWRRPNERYVKAGLYLPQMRSEQLGAIGVGVDTSGSTWHFMEEFATELTSIMDECEPEAMVVMSSDAAMQHVEMFQRGEEVKLTAKGCGGTDFNPVFDHIEKENIEIACLIYLTDLDGRFPEKEPPYPVLWVSLRPDLTPPFGETIYIDERSAA